MHKSASESLADAVAGTDDGCLLAVTKSTPIAAILALLAAGRRDIRLLSVPTAGFAADILAAAGALKEIETGAMVIPGYGYTPNIRRAIDEHRVSQKSSACPIIEMQLVAGAMGMRFTEIPGVDGTALAEERDDFRTIDDPFDDRQRLVIAPALNPDVALIHGLRADPYGNVVTSIHTEDRLVTRASRYVIATVERVSEDALEWLAADEEVIPSLLIDRVCAVPGGASPWSCPGHYMEDAEALGRWLTAGAANNSDAIHRLISEWTHV